MPTLTRTHSRRAIDDGKWSGVETEQNLIARAPAPARWQWQQKTKKEKKKLPSSLSSKWRVSARLRVRLRLRLTGQPLAVASKPPCHDSRISSPRRTRTHARRSRSLVSSSSSSRRRCLLKSKASSHKALTQCRVTITARCSTARVYFFTLFLFLLIISIFHCSSLRLLRRSKKKHV